MSTAKIKLDTNKVDSLKIKETFEKASTNYSYITYGIGYFPKNKKISVSRFEKRNNVIIPLFHEQYDSFKKDAELYKIGEDLYAVFTYRKQRRAVKLQKGDYHNQLFYYNNQL